MNWKSVEVGYIAGTPFVGANVDMYAGPGGYRSEFMAWDPVQRKKVWQIHEKVPVWSGALVTAGDVAFYGTMDRWFKAVDAKSGQILWQFRARCRCGLGAARRLRSVEIAGAARRRRYLRRRPFRAAPLHVLIATGVRKGGEPLRKKLDAVIVEEQPRIDAPLKNYGVPPVPLDVPAPANGR